MEENIIHGIFEQVENEAEAQALYAKFLSENPELREEDRNTILEIMQDEQNHVIKLLAMARRYGNRPMSSDGAADAIRQLFNGVGGS